MQIISADRSISDSADRVTEMFQNTPAFSGISGADLFQAPTENNEIPIASTLSAVGPIEFECTPILESLEIEIPTTYTRKTSKKSRKRSLMSKMIRSCVGDVYIFFQQMAVFSAQLQLIEEQRDYYRLKLQRLLENHCI